MMSDDVGLCWIMSDDVVSWLIFSFFVIFEFNKPTIVNGLNQLTLIFSVADRGPFQGFPYRADPPSCRPENFGGGLGRLESQIPIETSAVLSALVISSAITR